MGNQPVLPWSGKKQTAKSIGGPSEKAAKDFHQRGAKTPKAALAADPRKKPIAPKRLK